MVHWLIEILIGLAPNQTRLSHEARNHLEASRTPIENLIKKQKVLCEQMNSSTKFIVKCCAALTAEEMFTKQMHQESDAEKEVLDLKRMQVSQNEEEKKLHQFENKKKQLDFCFTVTCSGIIFCSSCCSCA